MCSVSKYGKSLSSWLPAVLEVLALVYQHRVRLFSLTRLGSSSPWSCQQKPHLCNFTRLLETVSVAWLLVQLEILFLLMISGTTKVWIKLQWELTYSEYAHLQFPTADLSPEDNAPSVRYLYCSPKVQ